MKERKSCLKYKAEWWRDTEVKEEEQEVCLDGQW